MENIIYMACLKLYSRIFLFILFSLFIFIEGTTAEEPVDSSQNYIKELWSLADNIYMSNTVDAIDMSKKAFQLAKDNNYEEGMSKSLGILANAYGFIGKYDLALDCLLEKVQLEEKRGNVRNMASALINIGLNYVDQKEYQDGLDYLKQAESLINKNNIIALKPTIQINLGDLYFKLKDYNLSEQMFKKVLTENFFNNKFSYQSKAKLGIANIYMEKQDIKNADIYFHDAINGLIKVDEKENLFEAYLGMANLKFQIDEVDSAITYAMMTYQLSKQFNSLKFSEQSSQLLSDYYAKINKNDSAYYYLKLHNNINDQIFSLENVRKMKAISINEKLRLQALEEQKIENKKKWRQQLQFIFLTIFIPTLFAISLFLSRKKVNILIIRLLGVTSLMFAFEFLTLLLHPIVANLTHHNPILEIMIFVLIGFIMVPSHHKIEKFFIDRLLRKKISNSDSAE